MAASKLGEFGDWDFSELDKPYEFVMKLAHILIALNPYKLFKDIIIVNENLDAIAKENNATCAWWAATKVFGSSFD